jgi:hypothetical protein
MNDNDIIKALDCYVEQTGRKDASCDGCPLEKNFPYCHRECSEDMLHVMWLDLINRQKAEIEALKLINSTYEAETKRVRDIAIKEFAERLKKHLKWRTEYDEGGWDIDLYTVTKEDIDNLVEEMTEGEDA